MMAEVEVNAQKRPKVSIIIPVYNDEAHVAEAIERALAQTLSDVEVVVVNDGSTDGTASILERYRDRVVIVTQENQGAGSSRNAGIRASCGEYLCFLDSDDRFAVDKVEIQARLLDDNPDIGVCYGSCRAVDARNGTTIKTTRVEHSRLDRTMGPFPPHYPTPGFMVRREWLERVGGYDSKMRFSMDTDLRFKLWAAGCRFMPHRDVVAFYTVRTGSLSGNPAEQWAMHLKALRRHFEAMGDAIPQRIKDEHLATTWLRIACGHLIASDVEKAMKSFKTALEHEPTLFERYESWALVIYYLDPTFPLPDSTWFPKFSEVWQRIASFVDRDEMEPERRLRHNERRKRGALAYAIARRAFFRKRGLQARWWLLRSLVFLGGKCPSDAHLRHVVQTIIGPLLTNLVVMALPILRKMKRR